MRLDPDHVLAPASVEVARELLARTSIPEPDEATLLRLALGLATTEERRACARAMAASPTLRHRFLRLTTEARRQLSASTSREAVDRGLTEVAAIDRLLSEGRWEEGSARLRRELSSLRTAWRSADELEMPEAAEKFARALLVALMEMDQREAFEELVQVGSRAAKRLGSERLQNYTMGLRGAQAARTGDRALAREVWSSRLEASRKAGNHLAEADTLIDLASMDYTDGDLESWARRLGEAELALSMTHSPDHEATIFVMRAQERANAGETEVAYAFAERAIRRLEGSQGATPGLFVRLEAGRAFVRCGNTPQGLATLADALERCIEAGSGPGSALALAEIGEMLLTAARGSLGLRCLALAHGISWHFGTRREPSMRARLTAARASHPAVALPETQGLGAPDRWPTQGRAILEELRSANSAAV